MPLTGVVTGVVIVEDAIIGVGEAASDFGLAVL
jgi:hypothetical protein